MFLLAMICFALILVPTYLITSYTRKNSDGPFSVLVTFMLCIPAFLVGTVGYGALMTLLSGVYMDSTLSSGFFCGIVTVWIVYNNLRVPAKLAEELPEG